MSSDKREPGMVGEFDLISNSMSIFKNQKHNIVESEIMENKTAEHE